MALIIPNTLLANANCERLRGFILDQCVIKEITDVREFVFEDVGVEVAMIFLQSGAKPSTGQYHEARDGVVSHVHDFDQKTFWENRGLNFTVTLDRVGQGLFEKVESGSVRVGSRYEVMTGIKEYQVGKGKPPQSSDQVENRVYNSNTALNATYRPELRGKNLYRFGFSWTDEYISYGPWLAEPRQPRFFEGRRIVLRQIPGNGSLVAAYVEKPFIVDQTAFVLLSDELDEGQLFLDLAMLNSKLCYWYFMNVNNEFDVLFPKIKAKEVKVLPLPNHGMSGGENIPEVVRQVIASPLDSTSRASHLANIDALVYQLYDLSAEEIALVEASVGRG